MLYDAGHHQDSTAVHILFHPAAQLPNGLYKMEAAAGIGDDEAALAAQEPAGRRSVELLMANLAETPAVQLHFRFLPAADGVAEVGIQDQQHHCCHCGQQNCQPDLPADVGLVDGRGGDLRQLQCFNDDAADDVMGYDVVVLDQRTNYQECGPGIPGCHLDSQQIGFRDGRGGDLIIRYVGTKIFQDQFLQDRTIQKPGENSRQVCGGLQVGIDRGAAALGGDYQSGVGLVDRLVALICVDVGADAGDHGNGQDQKPTLQNIPQQDNGGVGQQAGVGNLEFLCFFHDVTYSSTTTSSLV